MIPGKHCPIPIISICCHVVSLHMQRLRNDIETRYSVFKARNFLGSRDILFYQTPMLKLLVTTGNNIANWRHLEQRIF